jgi:ATP-dependent RNA helicase RhlE
VTAHSDSSSRPRRRRGPSRRHESQPRLAPTTDATVLPFESADFDPAPIPFDRLSLDERLLSGIRDLGWADTRPVQSGVIPLALAGEDVIACAETGTGKTAAFLIPILQRFLAPRPAGHLGSGTRALVLAPTRELAVQIEDQVQGLTYHTTISSIAVYGGVPMDVQERALRASVDIIVATPGRLMDHMRHDSTNFSALEVLVLDEADRMLDMGFWPDVQRILLALPSVRQTLLFSATMPAEVLELTREFLRDPKYVQVGRRGGPAQTISHSVQTVPAKEKTQWLAKWIRDEATGPVLVFCRTKVGADRLATRLSGMGIRAAALHADRTQQQRMSAVEGFRTGRYPVLVATDVAARGLDIEGIAHVVNFEVPDTPEAYVHRVGRTGRAETTGSALTLVAPEEARALRALEKAVGVQLQ